MKVSVRFFLPLAVLGIAAGKVAAQDESVVSVKIDGPVYAWETNDRYASESPYGDNYGLSTIPGETPASFVDDPMIANSASPTAASSSSSSSLGSNMLNIINNNSVDGDSDDNKLILLFTWLLDKLGVGSDIKETTATSGHHWHNDKPQDASPNTVTVTVTEEDDDQDVQNISVVASGVTTTVNPGVNIVVVTPTVSITQAAEQSVPPSNNNGFSGMIIVSNAIPNVSYVPVTVTAVETVKETDLVTVTAEAPVVQQNVQQIAQTETSVVVSQVPVVQTRLTASAQIVRVVGPTYTSTVNEHVQYYGNSNNGQAMPQVQQNAVVAPNQQPNVYTL